MLVDNAAVAVDDVEPISAPTEDPVLDNNVLQLDLEMLDNLGFLTAQDNSQNHCIQEEFREIKRSLLGNALTSKANAVKHPNLVMVSSALADEGKTFIAINLALSIAAEQDKTVLLVDADVYKPSVLRHCGIKPRKGLIEYLLGNIEEPGDIIYSTNVDKLTIMPTGTPHYLANELLASAKMTALIEELASRYSDRIVIFDCPPILGLTETAALSQLMGQAIIAVEENKTSIQKVNRACAMLNEDLAKGLVLNKALQSHKELYGTNSYGYDNKTIL
ncbi:exopolysaccharide biosynthesis protein [Thalassotalea litorea]|uniref:non-specific protein-tyrosine kinase n=2 Tax=Thalassotalea litorea TaxID=2020715 RepID=A0A5R9IK14_9GAMM|nr:exopolysaccharide biosynthesis protein [Thalassotalea litorea]